MCQVKLDALEGNNLVTVVLLSKWKAFEVCIEHCFKLRVTDSVDLVCIDALFSFYRLTFLAMTCCIE